MVCTSFTISETKEDRLKQALKEVWTDGGMSMAVTSELEAFRLVIKRQEEGRTKVAVVDNEAAFEFQSYLSKIEFQQQRCGVLYGTIEKEEVSDCAIHKAHVMNWIKCPRPLDLPDMYFFDISY